MSTEFEKVLAQSLISFEEIDWEEDRITLRVMSDGQFSDIEEAKFWGKVLANVTSTIVNKLKYKYQTPDQEMSKLYEVVQANYIKEISSEVADFSDDEG